MRKAFSMVTAIFVILLMATVSVMILNISSKTVKTTTIQYRHEQAILYAKSYTELAIMYASANDANVSNCAETINADIGNVANGEGYQVTTRIAYIGNDLSGCSSGRILNTSPITTADELQIIVDVYVQYHDLDIVAAGVAAGVTDTPPWITYHRRTLQKL